MEHQLARDKWLPAANAFWKELQSLLHSPTTDYCPTVSSSLEFTRLIGDTFRRIRVQVAAIAGVPEDEAKIFHSGDSDGGVEHLVDFSVCTYPAKRVFGKDGEWRAAVFPLGMIAACESEVGNDKGMKAGVQKILSDFIKLLDLNAPFKVMAYRVPYGQESEAYEELVSAFENILNRAVGINDSNFWMFVGVPWTNCAWPGISNVDARMHVLTGCQKGSYRLQQQLR